MGEQVTVNHWVAGSSPARGVPPFYDDLLMFELQLDDCDDTNIRSFYFWFMFVYC